VGKAVDEHGRVDVLVNNVGAVRLRLEGFLGTSDEEFEWAMQMNFFTALRATRAAPTPMLEQGGGTIVNVAFVNAFFPPDAGTIDYGAAKPALVNLTKTLSQEEGRGSDLAGTARRLWHGMQPATAPRSSASTSGSCAASNGQAAHVHRRRATRAPSACCHSTWRRVSVSQARRRCYAPVEGPTSPAASRAASRSRKPSTRASRPSRNA